MVLEYADLGDLETHINDTYFNKNKRIPERRIWRFFTQISSAIAYMHGRRLLHRGNRNNYGKIWMSNFRLEACKCHDEKPSSKWYHFESVRFWTQSFDVIED